MDTKNKFTVSATGDSLMVAPFPATYADDLAVVRDYLAAADLRITNLETNVAPFGGFASAFSGGTWLNTEPETFEDMLAYGFNCFGTANNHALDYSYGGLLSTLRILNRHGLAHAGSGRSLAEAAKPAVVKTPRGTAAVIAVTTSFADPARAGRKSPGYRARPGVNFVRSTRNYALEEADLQLLKALAEKSGVNSYHNLMVATGFRPPDKPGVFTFASVKFCKTGERPASECDPGDLARLVDSVQKAKRRFDYVFVLVHCHEIDGIRQCEPPAFLRALAHSCAEAGASAIFGGGSHELRPVEFHAGVPIFYSLGDFIYQGMQVKYLPADFMEKYGVPDDAPAIDGLMARSHGGKIGLQANIANFQTVIPRLVFEGGTLSSLEMLPVDLAFQRKDERKGLPRQARGASARAIFDRLAALSAPYGTRLHLDRGIIRV